jgi:hypothetical protein
LSLVFFCGVPLVGPKRDWTGITLGFCLLPSRTSVQRSSVTVMRDPVTALV